MITHEISPHKALPPLQRVTPIGKFKGKQGSIEHKIFIFERARAYCPFSYGDQVRYNKTKSTGMVIDLYEDFGYVEWEGLKPLFVEVFDYQSQELYVAHPSNLKKVQ